MIESLNDRIFYIDITGRNSIINVERLKKTAHLATTEILNLDPQSRRSISSATSDTATSITEQFDTTYNICTYNGSKKKKVLYNK